MPRPSDGGPAFPCQWENPLGVNAMAPDGQLVPPDGVVHLQGLSLRDWFAGQVIVGLLAIKGVEWRPKALADRAYVIADAMLAARNRVDTDR